jgi:hypothetical protein
MGLEEKYKLTSHPLFPIGIKTPISTCWAAIVIEGIGELYENGIVGLRVVQSQEFLYR